MEKMETTQTMAKTKNWVYVKVSLFIVPSDSMVEEEFQEALHI